ncbi:uncharacterized protein cubi_00428 [Cryptosporidium ubiquitum]|uniref:BRCT domain-containing protein n=1 Tax=Cryptosporidium ubiquitum TaxID=857276 RepID=A0A1J4MDZ0_9CRYT|nr:uncharacterized protein cubi_00428 [Cryptosporidium ubiquitum]OII72433.1 hypothetical protein cubi_00428 [Cryptosporidium ubiquitum]
MDSKIWNKKRFLLSGFEDNEYNLIKKKYIEKNGGKVLEINSDITDDDVDYLVCNYSKGYKHRHSNIDYQKLRTPFWIWLSVNDEWNYSLGWHPFFRPNGNFTYGILKGFQIYLIGYSRTMKGFQDREKSPRYIRKINDIGILVSFIEAQMGGKVIFDDNENDNDDYNKLSIVKSVKSVTKLALVCNKEEVGELINTVKEKNKIQTVVNLEWLFDCYDEGRIVSYRKYIYHGSKEELKSKISMEMEKEREDIGNIFKIIISHQVYLNHNEMYYTMKKFSNNEDIEIGRTSKEVVKYIQNDEENHSLKWDKETILVLIFNDSIEEQDFWYDLMNALEENVVFNIKLASKEKKNYILKYLQRMRIINDPENLFNKLINCVDSIIPLITKLASKVGCSIPSYISDFLTSESEFLDTVLKFTDFENITGLSGFIEYSNDNPIDIVNLNRSKAIKRFDGFEKEFSTKKFS